jgi:hypothetical protein
MKVLGRLGSLAMIGLVAAACADTATEPTAAGPESASFSIASGGTTIVTPADAIWRVEADALVADKWNVIRRATGGGAGSFVAGPGTPPLGIGSFQFEHLGVSGVFGNDKVTMVTYAYAGTRLADITALGYSTYRSSTSTNSAVQVPSLEFQIWRTGTSGFHTLVFEPVYNTSQGTVTPDIWQSWDAFAGGAGRWWATGGGLPGLPLYFTWSEMLGAYPDAIVIGHFGVNTGSGWAGNFLGNIDGVSIGISGTTKTYDFEPYLVATHKDQCMKNGWQNVRRADGSTFGNQGQCTKYVKAGK